jgi:hypothetical protein
MRVKEVKNEAAIKQIEAENKPRPPAIESMWGHSNLTRIVSNAYVWSTSSSSSNSSSTVVVPGNTWYTAWRATSS